MNGFESDERGIGGDAGRGTVHRGAGRRTRTPRRRPLQNYETSVLFSNTSSFEDFVAEVQRWLARRVQSRTLISSGVRAHRERRLASRQILRPIYSLLTPGQQVSVRAIFHTDNGWSYDRVLFVLLGSTFEIYARDDDDQDETRDEGSEVVPDIGGHVIRERTRDAKIDIIFTFFTGGGIGVGDIISLIGEMRGYEGERQDALGLAVAALACTFAEYAFDDNDTVCFDAAEEWASILSRYPSRRYRRTAQFMNEALIGTRREWRRKYRPMFDRPSASENQPVERVTINNKEDLIRQSLVGLNFGESAAVGVFARGYAENWINRRTFVRNIR